MKKVGWIVAIVLLLVSAYVGLWEDLNQLGRGDTALQRSVTYAVFAYGLLGLSGAVGLARRRTWSLPVIVGWAVATLYAATIASFAFHDPTFSNSDTIKGTVAAFASVAVVCGLVVWAARANTRVPSSAETGHIPSP
jgi:hypothetical protein